MKLSEKIIYLRKQQGMSQEELASKLNVSRQAVSRWEVGSALPDASNILQLSKLFNVTADYLLNDEFEKDLPAYHEKTQKRNHYQDKNRKRVVTGLTISVFSLVVMLIIIFLSILNPAYYCYGTIDEMKQYEGLIGYLKFHRIEWLFIVFLILFIAGIIMIFGTKIKRFFKEL